MTSSRAVWATLVPLLGAALLAQAPDQDAQARLQRRLHEDGRSLSAAVVESLIWKPQPVAVSGETGGYPSDPHADHAAPPADASAMFALVSGAFVIYAVGPRSDDAFALKITDTASGRVLKTMTVGARRPGELSLPAPCICKVSAAPVQPEESGSKTEQVITLAVLSVRNKTGR